MGTRTKKEYSGFGVIYKITCIINNKVYIGQTTRSLRERFSEHSKRTYYISNSIKKYGIGNFKVEIISICSTQEELNEKETYFIEYYKSIDKKYGYNLTTGGHNTIYTDEVKQKISDSMKGKNNHRFGKKVSEQTSLKMSIAQKLRGGERGFKKKSIICVETKITYESLNEASIKTGVSLQTLGRLLKKDGYSKKYKLTFKLKN